jgi:hypothetical protein
MLPCGVPASQAESGGPPTPPANTLPPTPSESAEAAIMGRLRQAVQQLDAAAGWQSLKGWQPDNPAHHCRWLHIACNDQGYVTTV